METAKVKAVAVRAAAVKAAVVRAVKAVRDLPRTRSWPRSSITSTSDLVISDEYRSL